jgi:endonuclease/exonuclease/phosphatase family metal-dependent hydrolase
VTTNTDAEAPSTLGIDVRYTDRVAILARTEPGLVIANPQHQNYLARVTVPTAIGPVVITDGWASVDATRHGRTVRFVTTHLSGIAPPVGVAEGNELLAGPAQTSLPLVVTGDFNSSATPGGADAPTTYNNMLQGGLVDVWADVQSGEPGLTCCQHVPDVLNPVSSLNERIDFVFVGGAVDAEEARVIGANPRDRTPSGLWPSDHAGVAAKLQPR